MKSSIILASQSPRRQQLLQWAEIDFEVVISNSDESFPAGLSFEETAMHIALNKALAVKKIVSPDKIILAADTIVVWDNKVLGKPKNRNEAIEFILDLSGSVHNVITGVCIIHEQNEILFTDTTEVSFHPLTYEQVTFYVDKYQPYDKAGAYAIQEWIGVVGIKSVNGDFYNVMGLPVSKVVQALNNLE
ncbi:MAG: Maf family nucleotide pyrophosphatase [Ferruginibacter sp.]